MAYNLNYCKPDLCRSELARSCRARIIRAVPGPGTPN
ncbi:hypothetical protein ACQKP5_10735 [Pseudomonas vancouverensis]